MFEFIGVILLTIIIGLSIVGGVFLAELDTSSLLIQECEKSLPRDQHCKLIAVPENVK